MISETDSVSLIDGKIKSFKDYITKLAETVATKIFNDSVSDAIDDILDDTY